MRAWRLKASLIVLAQRKLDVLRRALLQSFKNESHDTPVLDCLPGRSLSVSTDQVDLSFLCADARVVVEDGEDNDEARDARVSPWKDGERDLRKGESANRRTRETYGGAAAPRVVPLLRMLNER